MMKKYKVKNIFRMIDTFIVAIEGLDSLQSIESYLCKISVNTLDIDVIFLREIILKKTLKRNEIALETKSNLNSLTNFDFEKDDVELICVLSLS